MKIILTTIVALVSLSSFAKSVNCDFFERGVPVPSFSFKGEIHPDGRNIFKERIETELGLMEFALYNFNHYEKDIYPLGNLNLSIGHINEENLFVTIYDAQIIPVGRSEGGFWKGDTLSHNRITYRCEVTEK
jgi:hypothetical protein